jgi:Putative beta-barrel porin-2, OmpL-like. bbp2
MHYERKVALPTLLRRQVRNHAWKLRKACVAGLSLVVAASFFSIVCGQASLAARDTEFKDLVTPEPSNAALTATAQTNTSDKQRRPVFQHGWEFHRTKWTFTDQLLMRDFAKRVVDNSVTEKPSSQEEDKQQSDPKWQYGGFIDLAYPLDFNHPANRLFRSRGTAFRTDNVWMNMAAFYVRKKPSQESRWGVELTAQTGKDAEFFGFSATAPNIAGFKFLRQLGPTNVSYLAPAGKGLTLQAGIFSSLIGYDSLYAKDNFNYTRPWGADFTPYFMMGANASYPFTEKLTSTFFLVNGYWHLARANSAPSAGGQIAYKLTPRVTLKETILFGPHQRDTAFKFWRFLTDTIVERKTAKFTFASEYIFSTERVDAPSEPRALMMSWQLPARWTLNDRWSLSFRPEVFWDRDGRWTLAKQTVKAFTSTLEYKLPYRWTTTIFRLEHRVDDSRGRDGGFFRGAELGPGVVGLTPSQHLLTFATIFTFDSPAPK